MNIVSVASLQWDSPSTANTEEDKTGILLRISPLDNDSFAESSRDLGIRNEEKLAGNLHACLDNGQEVLRSQTGATNKCPVDVSF